MSWTRVAFFGAVRDLGRRSMLVALGAVLLAAFLLALVERRAEPSFAFDRALLGPTFGLLLPFGCLVLSRRLFRTGVEPALAPFAVLGVDRRRLLLGRGCAFLLATCAFALPLGFVVLIVTGPTASWLREVGALLWVGAFAGGAYGALVLFGAALGRHGPWMLLGLDWLLGGGSGWLALPWPRAHVRCLLGGGGVLDLGQTASATVLLGLLALWVTLSFARTPP